MMARNFRDASRTTWEKINGDVTTIPDLTFGCMLRIADAAEVMAKDHQRLLDDNEYLKRRNEEYLTRIQNRDRQIRGLRGVITKLKKRLEQGS